MHLGLPSLSVRRKRHEQRNSPWPQAPIHASVRTRPGREDCRPRLHPISSAVVSVWRRDIAGAMCGGGRRGAGGPSPPPPPPPPPAPPPPPPPPAADHAPPPPAHAP